MLMTHSPVQETLAASPQVAQLLETPKTAGNRICKDRGLPFYMGTLSS